jgi:PGF-pre-PGF domain-containing protein
VLFTAGNSTVPAQYLIGNVTVGNYMFAPVPSNGSVSAGTVSIVFIRRPDSILPNSTTATGTATNTISANALNGIGTVNATTISIVPQPSSSRLNFTPSNALEMRSVFLKLNQSVLSDILINARTQKKGLNTTPQEVSVVNVTSAYRTTEGTAEQLATAYAVYNSSSHGYNMGSEIVNITYVSWNGSEKVMTSSIRSRIMSPVAVNATGMLRDLYVMTAHNFSNVSTYLNYSLTPPRGLPEVPGGAVSYVQINSTIPDNLISEAKYVFSLNRTLLSSISVSPQQVSVYKYVNGSWIALPTSEVQSNATAYQFSALSSSFSTYAVGFATGSVAGDANPESITLASGYPLYLCAGGANYTFDGTAPSWTPDKNSPGATFTLASTNASLGHQKSDICEAYTTGASYPGLAIAGIGVNAIYYTFTGSSGASATSASLSYTVGQAGSFTVIMAAAGYYNLSAVTPPKGCTQQQFKSNVDTFESAYIATCPNQPAGSNSVTGTLSGSGSYVMGAYVFPPMNVIFDDVPASATVLTNGAQQASGALVQTLGTGTINSIAPTGNYVFWQWTTSNSLNASIANARAQNTVLTVEGNAVVTAEYNGITQFIESGLPSGTAWSVTYDGFTNSTTTTTNKANTIAGTWSYSIGSVAGYTASPASGSEIANGVVNIVFTPSSPTCTVDVSNTAINFGVLGPGQSVDANNAVTDNNIGSAGAYMFVYGGKWIVQGSSSNFYVSNTFYGNTLVSGIAKSNGFPLASASTNTLLYVKASGTNTIFFGTGIPVNQGSGTYNQIITVENVC